MWKMSEIEIEDSEAFQSLIERLNVQGAKLQSFENSLLESGGTLIFRDEIPDGYIETSSQSPILNTQRVDYHGNHVMELPYCENNLGNLEHDICLQLKRKEKFQTINLDVLEKHISSDQEVGIDSKYANVENTLKPGTLVLDGHGMEGLPDDAINYLRYGLPGRCGEHEQNAYVRMYSLLEELDLMAQRRMLVKDALDNEKRKCMEALEKENCCKSQKEEELLERESFHHSKRKIYLISKNLQFR
eukprot:c16787_g1_i1 orf=337-1071(-)